MSEGAAELLAIAAKLEVTGLKAPAIATAIVAKGADNIKKAMRDDAQGIRHAPRFPGSITYDVTQMLRGPEAEIGPDKDIKGSQGALGNLLYFGSSRNGPVRNISTGLDAEAPRFEKALADAAEPKL